MFDFTGNDNGGKGGNGGGTTTKKKRKRTQERTEPVYIKKLAELLGTNVAAANLLHTTGSNIGNYIRYKNANAAIEALAKFEYEKRVVEGDDMQSVLVHIPKKYVAELRKQAKSVGGSAMTLVAKEVDTCMA